MACQYPISTPMWSYLFLAQQWSQVSVKCEMSDISGDWVLQIPVNNPQYTACPGYGHQENLLIVKREPNKTVSREMN